MLSLRTASLDDAAAIVSLVTSAYRGDPSREGWTTEADLLEGPRTDLELVSADLADPAGRILLGFDAEELVACCHLVNRDEGHGYFGMFAVSPKRQGGGLGKVMLAEAERIVREEWQLTALELIVLEHRPELIEFYRRRGFEPTGDYVPFPYDHERFGTPRRDDLRMMVLRKAL